jgi:hypothetical protein
MKKLYKLLVLLTISASGRLGAQSVTTLESFDSASFAAAGWAAKQPVLTNSRWVRRTNGQNGTTVVCQPHSAPGLARYTNRGFAKGLQQNLVSKRVDYTNRGAQPATVSFWMYRDSFFVANEDSITLFINTADSLDINAVRLGAVARNRSIGVPDTQASNGWYQYSYSVPASFTTNTNYFIFQGTNQSDTANIAANIFIDDVSYIEYPPICTGIPAIGDIVAPNLLCDGGGTANLSLTVSIANSLGISYVWQSSGSASGPWTNLSSTTATASAQVTGTTFFQCIATCSYSGQTYTTDVDSVMVSADSTPVIAVVGTPQVVCLGTGTTAYMLASGANSYTWAPANVTALNGNADTVTIVPTANSQYTVTGTSSSGCSASATYNLFTSTGPNTSIFATPNDSICAGDTVILNSLAGGGGGVNTYLWSDGVTTRRDTIAPASTTTLSVIVTNSFGCTKADTIVIAVMPAAVPGFTWSATSATVAITNTSVGGISYNYTFGDGTTDTAASPSHTYTAGGTYTVTQYVTGFCGVDSITKIVSAEPTALGAQSVALFQIFPTTTSSGAVTLVTNRIKTGDQLHVYDILGHEVAKYEVKSNASQLILLNGCAPGLYVLRLGQQVARMVVE